MSEWISSLTRERVLEIALALALGTAVVTLAETLTNVLISALAQNVGRDPYDSGTIIGMLDLFSAPYYLYFNLGGTLISYGQVLSSLVVLGLLTFVAVVVVRQRDRVLGECPFCSSRIPHESRHCAYCGSSATASDP